MLQETVHMEQPFLTSMNSVIIQSNDTLLVRRNHGINISEMAISRLPRSESVKESYDCIMPLGLGAQAVFEDKYENAKSLCLGLNDCALEAFTRGLPDRMSAIVESRHQNTLKIALKYALDDKIKHQTNTQFLHHVSRYT